MSEDLHAILRMFGLRKYEAAVYVSLVRSGVATALEVSRKASVPLPRIYTTVKSLESRGYVSRLPGSPARYRATHPGHMLRAELSLLRKNLESILIEIEQEYETASSLDSKAGTTVDLRFGEKGLLASIIGVFESARSEIIGVLDDFTWCSEQGVLSIMKEIRKRRLKIRIIGKRVNDSAEDLVILRASTGASVKTIPGEDFKSSFLIKDKSEVSIRSGQNLSDSENQPSIVTIRDPRLSEMFESIFEETWKRASNLEDD